MNIFVLDECPIKAAQMQCDKHVVKMILETAQLLCSVFPNGEAPYKRTHYNHPCAIWTRESIDNYNWLIKHGRALAEEYKYRYNKVHKSATIIEWCDNNISKHSKEFKHWWEEKFTPFPKCMPDEYKVEDIVQSYRNYYKGAKRDIAKWTKRDIPDWFNK